MKLPRLRYALFATFLVRVVPVLVLPRGARYEMGVFRQVAETTLRGQSVYLTPIPHPHLPFQLYWFAVALWLNMNIGLAFVFWLKIPNIIAEVAVTGLIYLAVRRTRTDKSALFGAWLYAFNPVTVLVAAYQGQFDTTPLLFMLVACYLFQFHGDKQSGILLSSFVLGLGVLSKTWPVILLPIVLSRLPDWESRFQYSAISAAVPFFGTLFYELLFPGSFFAILKRSVHAGAIPGWWGYSSILNVLVELTGRGGEIYTILTKAGKIIALLGGVLTILKTRHRLASYSLLLTILTLFAAVPNLGLQGLSWVVPLAVLLHYRNELGWYVAGATVHMLVSYWGMHLTEGLYLLMPNLAASIIIQLSSLTAWIVVVIWWLQEVAKLNVLPDVFAGKVKVSGPNAGQSLNGMKF